MKYPKFLKEKSTIGICAPSMGVGYKIESYELSLKNLQKNFNIIETKSVRNNGLASNTKEIRAIEFNNLIKDKNIDMIWCASGGEILLDMLSFIDEDEILKNPKWIQGYSDPTTLLYLITTKLDIATIYGVNAGGFDQQKLHSSLEYNLNLLKGQILPQKNFKYYESTKLDEYSYNLDTKVKMQSNKEKINLTARLIGGCIECLNDIIGTPYDNTIKFIEKYQQDGFIWYFDIFEMSSLQLYRTLIHMKYAGWFKYAKGFIFGRVLIPKEEMISYYETIKMALEDIPFIMDFDIGHTNPKMTLINGSIATIEYKNNSCTLKMELK